MRTLRTLVAAALLGGLTAAGIAIAIAQTPSAGGAFLPLESYVLGANATWTWLNSSPWVIEGSTVDGFETTDTYTNPTADRTHTHQDATGTVVLAQAATSGAVEAGLTSLDGANPTSVTTNLSALAGCTVQGHVSAAPGLGPVTFTTILTSVAGRLDIYAWRATSASDPTLIADVSVDAVRYVCVGTR